MVGVFDITAGNIPLLGFGTGLFFAFQRLSEEKGAYGFGQGSDMESFAPKAQLFASVNHWDISYIEHIEAALDGTWAAKAAGGNWDTWCSMKDN